MFRVLNQNYDISVDISLQITDQNIKRNVSLTCPLRVCLCQGSGATDVTAGRLH